MRIAPWVAAWLLMTARLVLADERGLEGKWKTSLGLATITKEGDQVTVKFANAQIPTVKGAIEGKQASLKTEEGKTKGEASITLGDSGLSFSGWFRFANGFQRSWEGFRPDPRATEAKTGRFAGLWLTNLGLMELEQDGEKVKGRYAQRGVSTLDGQIKGRRLDLHYQWFRDGSGWFDLATDGESFEGAAVGDGFGDWYAWKGRLAPEFHRHVPLEAGKIIDGSTKNLLTYTVRAPDGYKTGDPRKWPTIVILHGSNMNAKAYVNTIAQAWPQIARDHLILGLNGETPSHSGADPRFNYTYVNFMGRSTYRGFPGTDRESPALVSEALVELKEVYPIARYFVGGHSQGGWLTYSLLMNRPELLAGAFPISCGLLMQCEPDVFDDAGLRKAQRQVPLAIVHARNDPVQGFGMGQHAAAAFGEEHWPALRFFTDESAGHMFARLPVDKALGWLETMASEDPSLLIAFAEKEAEQGRFRDAVAALNRARGLKLDESLKTRADRVAGVIDLKAKPGAAEYLPKIKADADGAWVDGFLAYRDQYEFAPAAGEVMAAFGALRARHEPESKRLMSEARGAFQKGDQEQGYKLYQEIIDKFHATSHYRDLKAQLESRK